MNKQFVTIFGITFLVGMMWLTFDIIFNTKASIPISPKLQTLLEPVTPTFNSRTLEIIAQETMDISEITVETTIPSPEPNPEVPVIENVAQESSPEAELTQ